MNRARSRERWLLRAERISDAFGLVLILVLATYVVGSLADSKGWDEVLLAATASTTSVVALVSAHAHAPVVRAAIALSLIAVAGTAIGAGYGGQAWFTIGSLIVICLLAVAMLAVLRRVVSSAEIGFRTILGALSFYAVLGILFTYVYVTIERLQEGAFFERTADASGSDFIFFSYTTLTTTGYGNLVPGGQPGRMFAGLEMMIGQIFLVTLVAGLVSLWRPGEAIRRRHGERAQD